ncbi:MAG: ACP S-malonyltransferase [Firmicutes bacterium]|nr:ACP S-malonyltransferase [Bacillota bacterium]
MKTAFIFSGQGAQASGMGKELYENFDCVKKVFDKADETLGLKISDICFNEDARLNETEYTQPAILTMSVAVLELMKEKGLKADYAAGLSLGEYSALVASGVLDFEQAVTLVRKRGRFMTQAVPVGEGGMCAVLNLDADKIQEACDKVKDTGRCMIANYNCPGQIAIAGDKAAVEKAAEVVLEMGAKRAVMLNVSGPFHTSLLKPASDKLKEELKNIDFHDMSVPVLTNLTGDLVEKASDIPEILTKQVMNPVKWDQSVRKMIELGVDTFVEMGPGKTLSSFVKKVAKDMGAENIAVYNVEDIKTFEKTIGGLGL